MIANLRWLLTIIMASVIISIISQKNKEQYVFKTILVGLIFEISNFDVAYVVETTNNCHILVNKYKKYPCNNAYSNCVTCNPITSILFAKLSSCTH